MTERFWTLGDQGQDGLIRTDDGGYLPFDFTSPQPKLPVPEDPGDGTDEVGIGERWNRVALSEPELNALLVSFYQGRQYKAARVGAAGDPTPAEVQTLVAWAMHVRAMETMLELVLSGKAMLDVDPSINGLGAEEQVDFVTVMKSIDTFQPDTHGSGMMFVIIREWERKRAEETARAGRIPPRTPGNG